MEKQLCLLLVEDDTDYAELLKRVLEMNPNRFEVVWVDRIQAAREWLEEHTPDLILTDLYLPDGSGNAFLDGSSAQLPYPVVIQTAFGDEQKAVEAIKAGAYEYLPKRFDALRELPFLLERIVHQWRLERERREIEERLQAGQSVFRAIFDNAPVGVVFFDQKGIVQACNLAFSELYGVPVEMLIGIQVLDIPDETMRLSAQRVLTGEKISHEVDFRSKPYGLGRAYRANVAPVQLPDGQITGGVVILEDITWQKNDQDLQAALYQIANLAIQAKTTDILYSGIHQIVKEILPAENFFIALWDKHNDRLSFPYWVDEHDPNPGIVPLGKSLTAYVLRSGQTLLSEDAYLRELRNQNLIERRGTPSKAWLGSPLKDVNGQVFGAVVVQSYDARVQYAAYHVQVMEYIAAQIGQVLARFRSEEEERKQRKIAETLLEATSVLSESLELSEVFEKILKQLHGLINYDNCTLTLIEGEWLKIVAQTGNFSLNVDEVKKIRWHEFETLREIYHGKAPLLIADVSTHPSWVVVEGQEWIRSYLGLPLLVKENVVGFLNLAFSEIIYIDPLEVQSLMAFANLAGQAIENARLYDQAQSQALHDELTGIYNRRGLNMLAEREFERALRYQRSLSVLFGDVDYFKQFNDRYSYATGDQVLRLVADCLQSHVREFDIVARFGGDEFVVVFPETTVVEARAITERLSQLIREIKVPYGSEELSFSLSFGMTEMVEKDCQWEDILERASQALKIAKADRLSIYIG